MEEQLIRCPNCHESYYSEHITVSTALFWEPIYKDGKNISKNPNTYTTSCTCMSCGQEFSIVRKDGEETKVVPKSF